MDHNYLTDLHHIYKTKPENTVFARKYYLKEGRNVCVWWLVALVFFLNQNPTKPTKRIPIFYNGYIIDLCYLRITKLKEPNIYQIPAKT